MDHEWDAPAPTPRNPGGPHPLRQQAPVQRAPLPEARAAYQAAPLHTTSRPASALGHEQELQLQGTPTSLIRTVSKLHRHTPPQTAQGTRISATEHCASPALPRTASGPTPSPSVTHTTPATTSEPVRPVSGRPVAWTFHHHQRISKNHPQGAPQPTTPNWDWGPGEATIPVMIPDGTGNSTPFAIATRPDHR